MNYSDYEAMRARAQQSNWRPIMNDEPIRHPLAEAVFQTMGAASTCWEGGDVPSGVFDTERAAQLGEELVAKIFDRETELLTAAAQAVARCLAYQDLLVRAEALLDDGWGIDDPSHPTSVLADWDAEYRATLNYPPLAEIDRLAPPESGS